MTDWRAKLPARRRVLILFWLLNAVILVALAVYVLR